MAFAMPTVEELKMINCFCCAYGLATILNLLLYENRIVIEEKKDSSVQLFPT